MLYLTDDVILNNFIQIACMPTTLSNSFPDLNSNAYAAGWGFTDSTFPFNDPAFTPDLLSNVKLTIFNSNLCLNSNKNETICAGLFFDNI